MNLKAYSFYSRLISFCLVLLGFTACKDDPATEYGVPSASYKVNGKVVSSQGDKKPIKNIRVVMIPDIVVPHQLQGDTVFTDQEGKFEINRHSFPDDRFDIKLQDVNEETNGAFENKTLKIEFQKSDYKRGKSWYKGEATKDMGTIEMTPKNNAE